MKEVLFSKTYLNSTFLDTKESLSPSLLDNLTNQTLSHKK